MNIETWIVRVLLAWLVALALLLTAHLGGGVQQPMAAFVDAGAAGGPGMAMAALAPSSCFVPGFMATGCLSAIAAARLPRDDGPAFVRIAAFIGGTVVTALPSLGDRLLSKACLFLGASAGNPAWGQPVQR
jgi:hypothetical protein